MENDDDTNQPIGDQQQHCSQAKYALIGTGEEMALEASTSERVRDPDRARLDSLI